MPEKKTIIVAGQLLAALEQSAGLNGTDVTTELRRAISLRKFFSEKRAQGVTVTLENKGKKLPFEYK